MDKQIPLSQNNLAQHISMAALALLTLYPALLGGAYLGYSILFAPNKQTPALDVLTAQLIAVGIAFLVGVGVLSFGIDKLRNPFLPHLARLAAVSALGGMMVIYAKMIAKLLVEDYSVGKFIAHAVLLAVCAFAVLLLDQVHPLHLKTFYAIPLLLLGAIHLNFIIVHYIFVGAKVPAFIIEDTLTLGLVVFIALLFTGYARRIINLIAYKLTKTIIDT